MIPDLQALALSDTNPRTPAGVLTATINEDTYTDEIRDQVAQITGITPNNVATARARLRRWARAQRQAERQRQVAEAADKPQAGEARGGEAGGGEDEASRCAQIAWFTYCRDAASLNGGASGPVPEEDLIDEHTDPATAQPCPHGGVPFAPVFGPACPVCGAEVRVGGREPADLVALTLDESGPLTRSPIAPLVHRSSGMVIDTVLNDWWGHTAALVDVPGRPERLRLGPTYAEARGLAEALLSASSAYALANLVGARKPTWGEAQDWLMEAWFAIATPAARAERPTDGARR